MNENEEKYPHKYRVKKAFGKISQVQRRIFGRWIMWRLFKSSDTGLEWIRKQTAKPKEYKKCDCINPKPNYRLYCTVCGGDTI